MLTDKPPFELSPLEELCLHFLIWVRAIRSGMMEYPVRRKPRRRSGVGTGAGTVGIAMAVPVFAVMKYVPGGDILRTGFTLTSAAKAAGF
jgi:hypothetical protein